MAQGDATPVDPFRRSFSSAPTLRSNLLQPAIQAPQPQLQHSALNLTYTYDVLSWVLNAGQRQPSMHWRLRQSSQLPSSTWHQLAHGATKDVFRAKFGQEPVIVKRSKTEYHPSSHCGSSCRELLYLEYLRGFPGVPQLLGGFLLGNKITWVVKDVGGSVAGKRGYDAGIVQKANKLCRPDPCSILPSQLYLSLARSSPTKLALAILRCFRSVSEVGGFFLSDFGIGQFAVAVSHGNILFQLVDGPEAYYNPIDSMLKHKNASQGVTPRPVTAYSGSPRRPVPLCATDTDCPAAHSYHCCCATGKEHPTQSGAVCQSATGGTWGANLTHGAPPEATGHCVVGHALPSGLALGSSKGTLPSAGIFPYCSPLTHKTHAFEVATQPWLLPLLARHSDTVRKLLPLMSLPEPSKRLSFSAAIKWLEARTVSHTESKDS